MIARSFTSVASHGPPWGARSAAAALFALLLCAGCVSPYLADRGRDAADVFTLTVGAGDGVKARVGPLMIAAIRNTDLAGLRGGEWFTDGDRLVHNDEVHVPYPVGPLAGRPFTRAAAASNTINDLVRVYPAVATNAAVWGWSRMCGEERFNRGLNATSTRRGKATYARSPCPPLAIGAGAPFYSQMELAGGLLLTLRIGFNPGELLDFLTGWFGADLYRDDLGKHSELPSISPAARTQSPNERNSER